MSLRLLIELLIQPYQFTVESNRWLLGMDLTCWSQVRVYDYVLNNQREISPLKSRTKTLEYDHSCGALHNDRKP